MMRMIHVGCHKCGSTFIQDEIFPRLRKVRAVSCSDGRDFPALHDAFFALVHCDDLYFDPLRDRVYGSIRDRLAPHECVLSWEGLSGHHTFALGQGYQIRHIARRLRDLFPEAGILIVIRNQKDLVRSYYMDDVTYGFSISFPDWIAWRRRYHALNYPKYAALIETYQRLFGRDRVRVLLFEEMFNPDLLRRTFESFGVDPAGIEEANLGRRHNPSLGPVGLLGARFVNLRLGSKLNMCDVESRGYHLWRWRYADRLDRLAKRLGLRLPGVEFAGYRDFLREEFAEDNRRASALIGRDLAAAGYP